MKGPFNGHYRKPTSWRHYLCITATSSEIKALRVQCSCVLRPRSGREEPQLVRFRMAVLLDNVRRTQAIRIGAGAALFFLNVWICWRLFFIEYTQHFGSVEPIFFTIAKAIRFRWPDLGWWQMWNTGMPFEYTYQPLLHYLVAATSAVIGWKEALAYHFVIATLYSLGPVTLYALALRLTRRVGASFAAGLLYTFLSPSALLIGKIATDMGG